MALKLEIDLSVCQAHGLCYFEAPELIDLRDEDGKAVTRGETVPAELEDAARLAFDVCPERAITLTEDS